MSSLGLNGYNDSVKYEGAMSFKEPNLRTTIRKCYLEFNNLQPEGMMKVAKEVFHVTPFSDEVVKGASEMKAKKDEDYTKKVEPYRILAGFACGDPSVTESAAESALLKIHGERSGLDGSLDANYMYNHVMGKVFQTVNTDAKKQALREFINTHYTYGLKDVAFH